MSEPTPVCPLCEESYADFRSLEDHLREDHSLTSNQTEDALRTAKVSFAERRIKFEQEKEDPHRSAEKTLGRLLDRYVDAKRRVDIVWKEARSIFDTSDAQTISELPVTLQVLIFRMEEALERAEQELDETAETMAADLPHIRAPETSEEPLSPEPTDDDSTSEEEESE